MTKITKWYSQILPFLKKTRKYRIREQSTFIKIECITHTGKTGFPIFTTTDHILTLEQHSELPMLKYVGDDPEKRSQIKALIEIYRLEYGNFFGNYALPNNMEYLWETIPDENGDFSILILIDYSSGPSP